MFNLTTKNGYKSYTAKRVKAGKTAKGVDYTVFTITSKDKDGKFEDCSVFYWGNLPIKDGDKVEITKVNSFECSLNTYKNVTTAKATLFADVRAVATDNLPKDVEVMEIQPIDETGELPF